MALPSIDLTKERWIAVDGSIYTEMTVPTMSSNTGKQVKHKNDKGEIELVTHHLAVAFNVGSKLAQHLVKLQNDHLRHVSTV